MFVMRLAQLLGLDVPTVHRRYVPSPVYLIDRFARMREAQSRHRRHAIDACQLLGLDRSFKYLQGSMASLAALAGACRSPAVSRPRLFGWLMFNVLVGNTDAHLKNLSFLVPHEGIQLAPIYDLPSVAIYESPAFARKEWPAQTRLAWPIFGLRHFSGMDRDLLLQAGVALHLARATVERVLENLRTRIARAAEALHAEIETDNRQIAHARPELSAILAAESRCLRSILHTVIKEMTMRTA